MLVRIIVPLPRLTVPDEGRSISVEILYFYKIYRKVVLYILFSIKYLVYSALCMQCSQVPIVAMTACTEIVG